MSALNVRPTLIDDLRPDSLAQLTFHPRLDRQLRRLATQCRDDLPNLLLYGPPGAGKRTRVIALLRRLLQPRVLSMSDDGSSLFERYAEHRTLFVNTQTRSATFMKAKRSKARGRPPKRSADQMLAGGDGGDDDNNAPPDDAASEDATRSTTAARTAAAAQKPSGSYNVILSCVGSPYHVEFTPADAGRKDAQVIQACIKLFCEQANTVATLRNVFQTVSVEEIVAGTIGSRNDDKTDNSTGSAAPQTVAGGGARQQAAALPYRVVIVNDADKLSFDAHAAMRRLMEEHVGVLRFILVAEQVTKIAPAIRSRCCQIRVPAPEQPAIVKSLQQAAALRECGGRFGGDRSLFDGLVAEMSAKERAEFFNDADDKRVLPQPTVFQLLDMAQSNVAYALTLLVFNDQKQQQQQQQATTMATNGGRGRRKKQATEPLAVAKRLVDRDELQRPGWAQETRALAKAFVCGYGYVLEARDRVEKAWSDQDVGPLNYTAPMLEWSRRVAYELLSRCVPMRDFLWLLLDDLLFWINHLCFYAENDEQVRREASNRWRERAIESQPERWSGERCDLLRVRCVQLCAAFEQRIVTAFRPIVQLDALFVHLVEACEYHRAGKALPDEQCSVPQIH